MKNILRYTLAICTAGLLPVACTSNFDEYNTNQNQMEMGDVHPLNLLEHILFTGADGMVYRTWLLNNELIQYTVQMYTENVHRYMIRDSYNSGTWNHLARWAANSDLIIEQAVKNGDANSEAIALTMRALFVSNWTDIYGDIPFIDHQLDLDDYSDYPRIPREQVTARLLQDLDDDLLDYLPVQWNPGTYGTTRIGRVAAYALKARIALNWGLWEEAARCSKIATTLAEGVYDLEPLDCTYYATHADGEPSAANLFGFAGQTSREWLWAIQYNRLINYTSATYYEAPRIHGGCSWLSGKLDCAILALVKESEAFIEVPLFDEPMMLAIYEDHPWANRDPRLDLFCLRPDTRLWGVQYDTDVRVEKVKDYNQSTAGKEVLISNADAVGNKSEYAANGSKGPGGYLWRKYSDKGMMGLVNGTKTEDDINAGIIRFAELLLIEAEANIEWDGGDLAIAEANINRVRARVNMPPVTDRSREGLRKALRYERKAELCNEGFRWFDIRRWKIASKAVNGPMYAPGYSTVQNPGNYISNVKPSFDGW